MGVTHPDSSLAGDTGSSGPTEVRARRPPRQVAGYAVAALLVGAVTTYLALWTRIGQHADNRLQLAVGGPQRTVQLVIDTFDIVSIGSLALVTIAAFGFALTRQRTDLAVAALVLIAGSTLSTELLKHVILDKPDYGYGLNNSLPSGHTTVATSVALAGMLVVAPRWRRLMTVFGGTMVTAVGAGVVVARWHRPADVIVAYAVCAVWGAVALAVAGAYRLHGATGLRQHSAHLSALLGAGVVAALVLMGGVRPTFGQIDLPYATLCLGSIGVAAVLCVGGFSRLLDRVDP